MELYHLFKLKFLILKNSLTFYQKGSVIKISMLFTFVLAFLTVEYLFFQRIFSHFLSLPFDVGGLLLVQLFNMLFLTFFSMLVFSNIITSLSTIYLSRDMEFLLASPIKLTNIFTLKFIKTITNSSWIVFFFALPIFVASGQVGEVPFSFYFQVLVIFIPFLIIPGALGILITILLMRFFPAKKTHQVLSLLGLIFGTGLIVFIRFLRPERLLKDVSEEFVVEFIESLKVPSYSFLPSTWATKGFLASLGNEAFSWPFYTFLLIFTALIAFLVSIHITARIFRASRVDSQGGRRNSLLSKPFYLRIPERLLWLFPEEQRMLWIKDIKLFWRETNQWSQIFMLGVLVVLYIYNIKNLPLNTIYIKNLVSLINIALAGFVLASVSLRFTYAGISLEGRAFWVLASSPLKPQTLIGQKFLFYFFPLVVLSEILVLSSNYFLGADRYLMWVSAGTIFFMTLGLTGLGVGLGARYPKFIYENPSEIGVSPGGLIYMLISMAYIGSVVSLEARPIYFHLASGIRLLPPSGQTVWFYYFFILILSLAVALIPLKMGVRILKNTEI